MFFWSESDKNCRETFGKCYRSTANLNDYDWYEPCEPELERNDLPWFYFITTEKRLLKKARKRYLRESKMVRMKRIHYWKNKTIPDRNNN